MARKLFWAPIWIMALALYTIGFIILTPIEALSQLGEEMNEGYRD